MFVRSVKVSGSSWAIPVAYVAKANPMWTRTDLQPRLQLGSVRGDQRLPGSMAISPVGNVGDCRLHNLMG
jgi:hypothetical protein